MGKIPAALPADGAEDLITFSKTVGESDVYLFAGITGDLSPVHTDHEFMKRNSPFSERIAHGVLVLGYTSAASTILAARLTARFGWRSMVSLGYEGIRFIAPVRIGDTITVRYRLGARDASAAAAPNRLRSFSSMQDAASPASMPRRR